MRALRGIVLAMFAAQMIITSFIIYMATFFQHVLGYGPLLASLALAPRSSPSRSSASSPGG